VSTAYIGIGANLEGPAERVAWAIGELAALGSVAASSLYRSEPLGDPAQPWYVNAVVRLDTERDPQALLAELQELERRAGRPAERPRWTARVLDLDLLLYDARVLREPGLTLPHPELHRRRFVLEPLCEIAPDARDPRSGRTAEQLLKELQDPLRVERLPGAATRPPDCDKLQTLRKDPRPTEEGDA
jgi:2-amino-4-hydroxy-6-hydroxymethyldihydropteridine diphosphokinase